MVAAEWSHVMNDRANKWQDYLHGLKAAASGNAQAFGFSILITVSYGITATSEPRPFLGDQIAFAMAAVGAFSLFKIVVAILARRESDNLGNKRVLLVATAIDIT